MTDLGTGQGEIARLRARSNRKAQSESPAALVPGAASVRIPEAACGWPALVSSVAAPLVGSIRLTWNGAENLEASYVTARDVGV